MLNDDAYIVKQFDCFCICGKILIPRTAKNLMKTLKSQGITCLYCWKLFNHFKGNNTVFYACDPIRNAQYHPNGYGFCGSCASVISKSEAAYDDDNQPVPSTIYYQRLLESLKLIQTNINFDAIRTNDRKLLQQMLPILVIKDHLQITEPLKILDSQQYDDVSKKWNDLLYNILSVEDRYKRMNERVINQDDLQQLHKMRQSITVLMYTMIRTKVETTEYYKKLAELRSLIDDKSCHIDPLYCVCGNELFEVILSDVFQSGFECNICGKYIEYSTVRIAYLCEVADQSKYHIKNHFVVCADCTEFMKAMQQQKDDNKQLNNIISSEEECKEQNEKHVEVSNQNLIDLVFKQLDKMGDMLTNIGLCDHYNTNKLIELCNRFKIITQRIEAWKGYFNNDDKQQINKRSETISDTMKSFLMLCHCGEVLSPIIIIIREADIICHHCFDQVLYGQTLYSCITGNKCEYFKNGFYLCNECAIKLKTSYKNCNNQQRIGRQCYDSIKILSSKSGNNVNQIALIKKWHIMAAWFTKYKDIISKRNENEEKMDKDESYYNHIYKILRTQFRTYPQFRSMTIDGKDLRRCYQGNGITKEFMLQLNYNDSLSSIKTTWSWLIERNTDGNCYQFCLSPWKVPKCVAVIDVDLVLFVPQISFCFHTKSYRFFNGMSGLQRIASFDLSQITMLTYIKVELHMRIDAIFDFNQLPITSDEKFTKSQLIHVKKSNPFKEGILKKQSCHLGHFRKRCVVLENYKLSTYKDEKMYENATEIFDLSIYYKIKALEAKQNGFILSSNNGSRKFLTSSPNETQEWIDDINTAINNNLTIPIKVEINRANKNDQFMQCKEQTVQRLSRNFTIKTTYSEFVSIDDLEYRAKKQMQMIHKGTKFVCNNMKDDWYGPIGWTVKSDGSNETKTPEFEIRIQTLNAEKCPFLRVLNTNDPLKCIIYSLVTMTRQFDKASLPHIAEFNHCTDEYMKQSDPGYDEGAASIHVSFPFASLLGIMNNTLKMNIKYKPFSASTLIKNIIMYKLFTINNRPLPFLFEMAKEHQYYFLRKRLTQYNRDDIIENGLHFCLAVPVFEHRSVSVNKFCEYLIVMTDDSDNDILNPLNCPIYKQMKNDYIFTEEGLRHLYEFEHFKDAYFGKPECRWKQDCRQFIRIQNSNKLIDRCHMKIYRHPPRNRQKHLEENVNAFITNDYDTMMKKQSKLYSPSIYHKFNNSENIEDGYLTQLINEVIKNGFKSDLYLKKQHDDLTNYLLMEVVNEKMKSLRHAQMGKPLNRAEMLSLVLYTGCDCNYNLCSSQRNDDFKKWKWFDLILYTAISKLSKLETGIFNVYTGLNDVKLDKTILKRRYFKTYVSTTLYKEVTKCFIGAQGMIIEIDAYFKENFTCCDVSWVSKFEDEYEVLFARATENDRFNAFSCRVIDEIDGIQMVKLVPSINSAQIFISNDEINRN